MLRFLLSAALLTACGGADPDPGAEAPAAAVKTIAVIPKGTTHEFWKSVHAGAVKAERELDGVEIIWKGPLNENDREGQIKVVEDFITRGVDGLVLAPLDDKALVAPVREAGRSGIPTVIIDSALSGDAHAAFVATDNEQGGRLAGERMVELLGGAGNVIVLRYQEGSASTTRREEGFLEVIAKHPKVTVLSDSQYGGPGTEEAYQKGEALLTAHRGPGGALRVDGIYCPNESTTFGMLRALQDAKIAGEVRFIGFDATDKLVAAMAAGEIDGLMVQDPLNMGYLGVKAMAAHLGGAQVEAWQDTGVTLVTAENMKDPAVAALLKPPLDRYLKGEAPASKAGGKAGGKARGKAGRK